MEGLARLLVLAGGIFFLLYRTNARMRSLYMFNFSHTVAILAMF